MDNIKSIFIGIAFLIGLAILPYLAAWGIAIGSLIIPVLLLARFLLKLFIRGNIFLKATIIVFIVLAIDYFEKHPDNLMGIWGLAGVVYVFYSLFSYVSENHTGHIQ
jgi:hypothetical protein